MSPAGDPGPSTPQAAADPQSAEAQLALGNACMQAGRYADAAAAYARSLAGAPGNPSAHNNLAVAFAEQRPVFARMVAGRGASATSGPARSSTRRPCA